MYTFTFRVANESTTIQIPHSEGSTGFQLSTVAPHSGTSLLVAMTASGLVDGDWLDVREATCTTADPKISVIDDELWWFGTEPNGDNVNAANYDETQGLSATDLPRGTVASDIQWTVTSGTAQVDITGNEVQQGWHDTATGGTIVAKSTGGSNAMNDVNVNLTVKGANCDDKKLTVKQPAIVRVENHLDGATADNAGFETVYNMTLLDQFSVPMPRKTEMNESFGAVQTDTANNWEWGVANAWWADAGGAFHDLYRRDHPDWAPPTVTPTDPLGRAGTEIHHRYQFYWAGSLTTGHGILVKGFTLQIYEGYARQL